MANTETVDRKLTRGQLQALVSSFREGYFNICAGLGCFVMSMINIIQDKAPEWMVLGLVAGMFSILIAPITRRVIARNLMVAARWLSC